MSVETQTIQIEVNNRAVDVPRQTTGAEIKRLAAVDASFQLFRIEGHSEHPVGNDDQVTVHEGEKFVASPTLDPS